MRDECIAAGADSGDLLVLPLDVEMIAEGLAIESVESRVPHQSVHLIGRQAGILEGTFDGLSGDFTRCPARGTRMFGLADPGDRDLAANPVQVLGKSPILAACHGSLLPCLAPFAEEARAAIRCPFPLEQQAFSP